MVETDINISSQSAHKSRGKGTKWIFRQLCIVPEEDEEIKMDSSKTIQISPSSSHKMKTTRRSLSCNDVNNSSAPKPTRKSLHNSHDGLSIRKLRKEEIGERFSGDEKLPSLPDSIISFETELTRVLNHKECAIMFRKWCLAHHCEENMEFWIDVEILKKQSTEEDFKQRSEAIYGKYLSASAPFPINVDYDLTQKMGATLKLGGSLLVEDYVAAQESVFRLMENGCIRRFLESEDYKKWRETAESSTKRKKSHFGKRNHRLSNQGRTTSQGTLAIESLFSKAK
eukprot:TRINITY_DN4429_c0_g1_i1.p1 TRINITY_DN4429_c0_g1~~TRINITY_DN4429_c0_g1_i1.p1  ORF type:complete len:284 (+),score=63.87 TRINITY_DN4429_c0_g1_i1:300-1151(+)